MKNFSISSNRTFLFGENSLSQLGKLLAERGTTRAAVFIGASSFSKTAAWKSLEHDLSARTIDVDVFHIAGEPSPELVDGIAAALRKALPSAIVSIGGGSVIDAGKTVSGLVYEDGSVTDFLEGIGTKTPSGNKVFFVAAPTTAGTGSEATKNAVISKVGRNGFKKSFRHDALMPDVAIVDPLLALSCPKHVTAASGMDAITQLLEAYTSTKANPYIDALAESGIAYAGKSFKRAVEQGSEDAEARAGMAYAAYISGMSLAHAGLGIVHGVAGPVGGLFPVAHGVVCGTLIAIGIGMTIAKLENAGEQGRAYLSKFAKAGVLLSGRDAGSLEGNCRLLIETLENWLEEYDIPRLGAYGICESDLPEIAARSDMKNCPVVFSKEEIVQLLKTRL